MLCPLPLLGRLWSGGVLCFAASRSDASHPLAAGHGGKEDHGIMSHVETADGHYWYAQVSGEKNLLTVNISPMTRSKIIELLSMIISK
jgi:hypothetical protein